MTTRSFIRFLSVFFLVFILASCSLKLKRPDPHSLAESTAAITQISSPDTWGNIRAIINNNIAELDTTKQDTSAALDIYSGITPSADVQTILSAASMAGIRESLNLQPGVDFYTMSAADAAFQPLETTLTDIADGMINENLVNTAYPWADNEVANDITLTDINQITARPVTGLTATNWRIFYSSGAGIPVELPLGGTGTYLQSNGASSAPTWATPSGSGDMLISVYGANDAGHIDAGAMPISGDVDMSDCDSVILPANTQSTGSPSPGFGFKDNDCSDSDINYRLSINATDTGSGTEDINVTELIQIDGVESVIREVDADGSYKLGSVNMPVQVVGDLQVDGENNIPIPVSWTIFDSDTDISTGDGKQAFTAHKALTLIDAIASVHTQGVTGTTDIQVRKRSSGTDSDMLTTPITIGAEYSASDGVINTGNNTLAVGDQVYIDRDAIHTGTVAKGLSITLIFQ